MSVRRLGLALLTFLTITPPASAAVLWFSGVETGDTREFSVATANCTVSALSPCPKTGAYCLSIIQGHECDSVKGLNQTTIFARFWWRAGNSTADNYLVVFNNVALTHDIRIRGTTGSRHFFWSHDNNTAIATGTFTWALNTWYLIEIKAVVDASVGGVELKVDGVVDFTSLGSNTSNLTQIDYAAFGPSQNTGLEPNLFDDLMLCSTSYCPHGGTVARQGKAGTPTYDAWTKNSCTGGTIDGCWSNTPFTTGSNASSTVVNDAQTMLVHGFDTTQSGHGSETLLNVAAINACKVVMIAKAGSSGTLTIRRRLGGVDTDTAKTVTTSDALYDDGIWVDTLPNLNSAEIGVKQGANAVTQTVEDMWEMCDYLAATGGVKHRVYLQ